MTAALIGFVVLCLLVGGIGWFICEGIEAFLDVEEMQ